MSNPKPWPYYKPVAGQIFVEIQKQKEQVALGIIDPNAGSKKRNEALVLAVGGDLREERLHCFIDMGTPTPAEYETTIKAKAPCAPGDIVLINPSYGREHQYEDEQGETKSFWSFGFGDIGGVKR